MSGPLALYRTTVNLRGLGAGTQIEIDPADPGWAGDIAAKRIVPANVATSETYVTDDDEPRRGMSDLGARMFERDALPTPWGHPGESW